MRIQKLTLLLGVCVVGVLAWPVAAWAAPGWEAFTRVSPAYLPPGGTGRIELHVYNTGSSTGEDPRIVDQLPPGVSATSSAVYLQTGLASESLGLPRGDGECSGVQVVTCTAEVLPAGTSAIVRIEVSVNAGVGGDAANHVDVTGGGALSSAVESTQVRFSGEEAPFGFSGFDAWLTNADGTADTQAGSHPYEMTVVFSVNGRGNGGFVEVPAGGETQQLVVNLPPGIVGDPTATPRCSRRQFDGETGFGEPHEEEPTCPALTQVGMDESIAQGLNVSFKVYNLVPPPGIAAEFAFDDQGTDVFLNAGVRSGGPTPLDSDYGITVHTLVPQKAVTFNTTTIWGVPSEESHNEQREVPSSGGSVPLLTLPTSCEGPQEFSIEALDTWQYANLHSHASVLTHDSTGTPVGFTGCSDLGFDPSLSVAPDTSAADTPAGLTTEIKVPQEGLETLNGIATSNQKDATVVLPEGLVLNPGRASGLAACPLDEDGVGQEGPPRCPSASQVGTATVLTPLLAEPLEGKVYVVESQPPEVKLLIALAGQGIEVKLVGDVHLNTSTGQLTTVFKETPEVPFTSFKLAFSGGSQAALVTPPGCGLFTSASDFTPWSSPAVEDVFSPSSFQISTGTNGAPCQSPLPFTPSMIAGATTDQAGGYTAFSLLLSRADDQQRISKLQFKTPKGLLGMISHVQLCEEPQAAKGECPSGSQIGHTIVGAGAGPDPLYVPEEGKPEAPIYISGPHEGAPYGLVISVPVIAGPFNLGTTVVRGKIEVDPQTSQLTITTDPLPVVLDGVPVDMRTINAVIGRKEFMFNPTNCNPQSFSGTATSTEGTNAALSSPFQVGSCRSLTFKPGFKVSTSAKTSRTQGASLDVKMTLPDEGGLSSTANVQRVKVSLPKGL